MNFFWTIISDKIIYFFWIYNRFSKACKTDFYLLNSKLYIVIFLSLFVILKLNMNYKFIDFMNNSAFEEMSIFQRPAKDIMLISYKFQLEYNLMVPEKLIRATSNINNRAVTNIVKKLKESKKENKQSYYYPESWLLINSLHMEMNKPDITDMR